MHLPPQGSPHPPPKKKKKEEERKEKKSGAATAHQHTNLVQREPNCKKMGVLSVKKPPDRYSKICEPACTRGICQCVRKNQSKPT